MNNKLLISLSTLMIAVCVIGIGPAEAKRWDPATLDVERVELAPNVYAVLDTNDAAWLEEGASAYTSSGFIVGERGVLVIDTYVNARLAGQLLGHVNAVTRKPILYVVNTSYHGDHMYGNYMFPNATIIQHEETKRYVDEKWDNDLVFMKNMFGHPDGFDYMDENSPRTGDILLNDDVKVVRIDLGDRIVEIRRFGFMQTRGDLQVWVPDARIFWSGNGLVGPRPILPWLTEGGHSASLATLRRIKDFLPEDTTVVSGHSLPFKLTDADNGLDHHIAYLTALDRKVKEAVDKGLTLIDTIDYAALEKFNGYDLFNWVHKQMNIPCAYRHYMMAAGKQLSEDDEIQMRHCSN